MRRPNQQTVVGIGELLWDCYDDRRLPGGAPANVAFHAAQLEHRAVVCSRVGADDLGRELREYMAARGLETDFIQQDERRPTGRVTVDTSDPARPSFEIHENAAWDALAFEPRLADLMAGAAAVCVGTLGQRSPASRETIGRCLEAAGNALVVFDVNLRQDWYRRGWIEDTLQRSRIVKLNLDEVGVLGGLLEMDGGEPQRFAATLMRRHGPELVCVTRAERGCLLVGADGETHDLPGTPVRVVDAVGAGDAFTAALISARLRGWPLRTAGCFANEVGARVAGHSGAMPDLRDELRGLVLRAESGDLD